MSELDQTTGLPSLPDGHWWEVRKYEAIEYGSWGFSSTNEDGYQVCIVKNVTIPASSKKGLRWWEPDIVTPEKSVSRVVHSKQIIDPALDAKRSTVTINGLHSSSKVGKRDIGPDDILKAALDVMDDIEELKVARDRRAKSDALIGAYPPKALAS